MNISDLMGMKSGTYKPTFTEPDGDEPTQPTVPTDPTVTTETDTPGATTTQQSTGAEFSTFLTLLTAQIRNQDPLAPLDSTQFVEQLATFSSLELQVEGNEVLQDIALLLAQQLYVTTSTGDVGDTDVSDDLGDTDSDDPQTDTPAVEDVPTAA